MRGRAGDRRPDGNVPSCCQVYACPINVEPIAPRHRGIDAGAKMKMLIFRDAGVLHVKCPVHLSGGIDGVGYRLETS